MIATCQVVVWATTFFASLMRPMVSSPLTFGPTACMKASAMNAPTRRYRVPAA